MHLEVRTGNRELSLRQQLQQEVHCFQPDLVSSAPESKGLLYELSGSEAVSPGKIHHHPYQVYVIWCHRILPSATSLHLSAMGRNKTSCNLLELKSSDYSSLNEETLITCSTHLQYTSIFCDLISETEGNKLACHKERLGVNARTASEPGQCSAPLSTPQDS